MRLTQRDKRSPQHITYLRGFKPVIKKLACLGIIMIIQDHPQNFLWVIFLSALPDNK